MRSPPKTPTRKPSGAGRAAAKSGSRSFVPDVGDLIWLDFDPKAGHEQAGRRPAVVLSPAGYNAKTGLAVVCPITSQQKNYPFEVALPAGLAIRGVILADHVKNLDWRVRHAAASCKAPSSVLAELRAKLAPLLGF
ncbi:MAG TPA: endoribonuclease MazF [Alphaproteobacteria bacterium]